MAQILYAFTRRPLHNRNIAYRFFGSKPKHNFEIDYYRILGISSSCDQKEIRNRYLQLAKRYHPDAQIDTTEDMKNRAKRVFTDVQTAYQVLGDARTRGDYDAYRSAKTGGGAGRRRQPQQPNEEPRVQKPAYTQTKFTDTHIKGMRAHANELRNKYRQEKIKDFEAGFKEFKERGGAGSVKYDPMSDREGWYNPGAEPYHDPNDPLSDPKWDTSSIPSFVKWVFWISLIFYLYRREVQVTRILAERPKIERVVIPEEGTYVQSIDPQLAAKGEAAKARIKEFLKAKSEN